MTAAELFVLGRKLMVIAEKALPRDQVGTSIRLVLMDIAFNPGSSISQITSRTGFPQSHVSASVARLRELGVVRTGIDPTDRRRTLVHITPLAARKGQRAQTLDVEQVLASALGDLEAVAEVSEVVDALEWLAHRLIPNALAHMREEVAS